MVQCVGARAEPRSINTRRVGEEFRGTYRKSEYARTKPDGGFCFIPAIPLIAAWWAFKARFVTLGDLRVWLGFFEVVARRCVDRKTRSLSCVEHELTGLAGLSIEQLRASIRRLERAGLLLPNRTVSRWWHLPDAVAVDGRRALADAIQDVQNNRRRVPVPRRLIRFLCRTSRPVMWATVLGHVFRCLYYRNGQCAPDGRCKASWVASVFDVDLRNVKAARSELVEIGVLLMDPSDQCSMNRWGPRVRFNLEWNGVSASRRSPPPLDDFAAKSPPPKKDRELASRLEDQKPHSAGGSCSSSLRWHVTPSDLASSTGVDGLYHRLVASGVCVASEASRLSFFAAAARTRRVARQNPLGFLATIVRRGLWSFATNRDEDVARTWLRKLRESKPSQCAEFGANSLAGQPRPRVNEPARAADVLQRLLAVGRPPPSKSPAPPVEAATRPYPALAADGPTPRPYGTPVGPVACTHPPCLNSTHVPTSASPR